MKENKQRKYLHLYSRTEFFRDANDINFFQPINKAVNQLFKGRQSNPLSYELPAWDMKHFRELSPQKRNEVRKTWRSQVNGINRIWVKQMMKPQYSFTEKMTLFWHGHFACRTVPNPYTTLALNNVMRKHCFGNFRDLLVSVSESVGMIDYLHLKQNRKGHPNEDFARELMELFTLGRDVDYSEHDVVEVARAFTGWSYDHKGDFVIRKKQQDAGSKTIFGKTSDFNGYDVFEMILENRHCADFIAAKVYKFFVREKVNLTHVKELSEVFFKSDYDIEAMMRYLLNSDWFYESQGELIKSPIDLIVGIGKLFDLKLPDTKSLLHIERYLDQVLFDPPNVAGWPGGRKWIDSSRMAFRLRLGSMIVNKGILRMELNSELDAMLTKKSKSREMKFYEEIDWEAFWNRNNSLNLIDLIIRNENANLRKQYNEPTNLNVVQLISTPDFQLI